MRKVIELEASPMQDEQIDDIDIRLVSPYRPVSEKQLWLLCALAVEALGYEMPRNRRAASALIGELAA
jgi:hypothetical protein